MKQLTEGQLLNLCSRMYAAGREHAAHDQKKISDLTTQEQVAVNDFINAEIQRI